jgi:hypothetical protein
MLAAAIWMCFLSRSKAIHFTHEVSRQASIAAARSARHGSGSAC